MLTGIEVQKLTAEMSYLTTQFKQSHGVSPAKLGMTFEEALESCTTRGDLPARSFDHKLYERGDAMDCIASHAKFNFLNREQDDHKNHRFVLIAGASGIGKTRIGFESSRALATHVVDGDIKADELTQLQLSLEQPVYIYINFNNGEQFSRSVDANREADVRLGIRLASAGILKTSMEHVVTECKGLHLLSAGDVMSKIVENALSDGKAFATIIVHLDEFPFYIDAMGSNGKAQFKLMLNVLGKFMRQGGSSHRGKFCILPILTGTSARDVTFLASDYGRELVFLDVLSHESALSMFKDKFGAGEDSAIVSQQSHFCVALADAGGIPSYIASMLSPTVINQSTDWGSLVARGVRNINLDDFGGVAAARTIVAFALTAMPVAREFILPGGKPIGDLERCGHLFLAPIFSNDSRLCRIHMPFVQLRAINMLFVASNDTVFDNNLLFSPSLSRAWYWQDFEVLHAQLQSVRINALLAVRTAEIEAASVAVEDIEAQLRTPGGHQKLRSKLRTAKSLSAELQSRSELGFTVAQVMPGALGSPSILDRRLALKPMQVGHETVKCLVEITDVAAVVSMIECKEGQCDSNDRIFLCSPGNALIDGRFVCASADATMKPILFVWQDKHSSPDTERDTVNKKFILDWHANVSKAMKSWKNSFDVVYVFLTNRRLTKPHEFQASLPTDLLAITRIELSAYLSPTFAGRGLLAHPNVSSTSTSSSSTNDQQQH